MNRNENDGFIGGCERSGVFWGFHTLVCQWNWIDTRSPSTANLKCPIINQSWSILCVVFFSSIVNRRRKKILRSKKKKFFFTSNKFIRRETLCVYMYISIYIHTFIVCIWKGLILASGMSNTMAFVCILYHHCGILDNVWFVSFVKYYKYIPIPKYARCNIKKDNFVMVFVCACILHLQ